MLPLRCPGQRLSRHSCAMQRTSALTSYTLQSHDTISTVPLTGQEISSTFAENKLDYRNKNQLLLEKAVIQHGLSRSEAHTAFNNYVYELSIMTYPLRDVLFTEFSLPKNVV